MQSCITFAPIYMYRVWGGRELEACLNRKLPADTLIGESWELVDRKEAQSVVDEGPLAGTGLHELWQSRREEIFGAGLTGDHFPLLIKILDAAAVLSVQVHPPIAVAEAHYGEPKCEIWYFARAKPGAAIYAGLKHGVTRGQFTAALDEGTLASLLHRIPTREDDFIFIPNGRLHAIDAGNIIFEIQQNSDTTYRVFDWNRADHTGARRELHIKESLAAIDFDDHEPALGRADGELLVECDHFRVERWALTSPRRAGTRGGFAVFQVARGRVRCGDRTLNTGELFLVPAAVDTLLVPQDGSAILIRTSLGSG